MVKKSSLIIINQVKILIAKDKSTDNIDIFDRVSIKEGFDICDFDFKKIKSDGLFILVDDKVSLPAGFGSDKTILAGLVTISKNGIKYITPINNLELAKAIKPNQNGQ